MSEVYLLLCEARRDPALANLPADAARGAVAYLQAYDHVAFSFPYSRPTLLRVMAARYLEVTPPPLTEPERAAAALARQILKRAARKRRARH